MMFKRRPKPEASNETLASRTPPAALVAEAQRMPGGWVYEIVGEYGPDDAVPPSAIRGGWKVDDHGVLTGEFLPNPHFKPSAERPTE